MVSRPGAELFARPAHPNQRRYEALRAYFVEGAPAGQVAVRFGYTHATVETLVRDYRAARLELFASSRPGPRSEPKKDSARAMILSLRREGRSLAEIMRALSAAGTPLGRTAIWEVVCEEGLGRLPLQTAPAAGSLTVQAPKTQRPQPGDWPVAGSVASEHAGLFLLLPELIGLDVSALVAAGGYPGTTQLTALNSLLAILALKLYERRRRSHVYDVVHDRALGVFRGLSVLPKRSHPSGYPYRTTRTHNQALLEALVPDRFDLACAYRRRTLIAMTGTKSQRMHLRVAATDDELFRSAAAVAHESLSEFLVASGRERAERVLADRTRFVLPAAEWRAFTHALDRSARTVPELVELFRRPRPE